MLFCPSCTTPLVAIEFQKVELDYCPHCRGCWFDRNELALLLHGDPSAELRVAMGVGTRGAKRCPRCGDPMDITAIEGAGLHLDRCRYAHGWWLDAGELRALIQVAARRPDLAALSDFCDSAFGAAST